MAEAPAVAKPAAGATRDACAPGVAGFEVLAEQVQDLAREHHLPKEFVEKTLTSLREALSAPPSLAQVLVEKILAALRTRVLEAERKRRKKRGAYVTLERQRLLALVARMPGMRTSAVAREAGSTRQVTHRSLAALLSRGLVARHTKGENPLRGWYVTKAGADLLNEAPEVKRGMVEGYSQVLVLIEERLALRTRLLGMGWSYDQVRDVLPFHAVSYIRREIAEVFDMEKKGFIWSPTGALWFRLGTEPREMRKARIFAATLPKDARVPYVEAMRENAKRKVFQKRREGIARRHLPEELRAAYVAETKDVPFYLAKRLAFRLRKMAAKGLSVTLSTLHEVLHELRKEWMKRSTLPLEEDGEPQCGPRFRPRPQSESKPQRANPTTPP